MRTLLVLLLVSNFCISAQTLKKLRDIKLPARIDRISVDRLGGFYTVNDCGINKFDPEGNAVSKYQTRGCTPTELLEAWGNARIFAFQKSSSRFVVFDPKMDILDFLAIDPAFAVDPQLAAPAPNMNSYWILDIDKSIKKVDGASGTVTIESDTLKKTTATFTHMREYQGMLFLLDPGTGIYILNKLGKLISIIKVANINYFNFAGEDLYYLKDNSVHFIDIFSNDAYSVPVAVGYRFVVATDERLILIKNGQGEVFAFTPKQYSTFWKRIVLFPLFNFEHICALKNKPNRQNRLNSQLTASFNWHNSYPMAANLN